MYEHSNMAHFAVLVARVLFTLIFIAAGVGKIMDFTGTAAAMTSEGLPYANILLIVAIVFELGGGLMILFGYKARLGALFLLLFTLLVTVVFHDFWTFEPAQAQNQIHHFMKNLSMLGMCLYIMVYGAGKFSFDWKKSVSRVKSDD